MVPNLFGHYFQFMEIYRMKKSLLAVAAIGAFASAAQAQSSVTVYGILDVGYSSLSATAKDGYATKVNEVNAGNQSTSRLGVKGVEDLGNGMKAGFTAEFGLNPTSPNLSGSSNNYYATTGLTTSGSTMDNRQTFVSLEKAGVGTIKLGRQYTLVHEAVGSNTAAGANNVVGDALYSGGNSSSAATYMANRDDNYTIRATQAVNLVSPTVFGLTASGQFSPSAKDADAAAGTASSGATYTNVSGARLNYVFDKLNVDLAAQNTRVKRDNLTKISSGATVMIGNTIYTVASGGLTALPIVNTNTVDTAILASYDFGIVKAFYGHATRQTMNQDVTVAVATQVVKKTVDQLGVKAPITPTIDVMASYSRGKYQTTSTSQNFGVSGYQLGANYMLSKRTNLYAIYGASNQDTTTASGAAKDTQAVAGIRHTF
jgi:predicted porin